MKPHRYIDVKQETGKLEEMLKISNGQRRVPVILQDGKVTVGFNGGT